MFIWLHNRIGKKEKKKKERKEVKFGLHHHPHIHMFINIFDRSLLKRLHIPIMLWPIMNEYIGIVLAMESIGATVDHTGTLIEYHVPRLQVEELH